MPGWGRAGRLRACRDTGTKRAARRPGRRLSWSETGGVRGGRRAEDRGREKERCITQLYVLCVRLRLALLNREYNLCTGS